MAEDTEWHVSMESKKRGYRAAGIIIRLIDSTVNIAVLTAFLFLFSYGCYALWDSAQVYEAAYTGKYEVYKPTEEGGKTFEELREMNPEVISWLTVYDTNIDYPCTQAENNSKYVNTDVEGEYSLAGSIFLDCGNQKDFSDFNSILYGHHMAKNAMFGDLEKFKEKEFFDIHPYGNLYYNGENHGIEFFAFIETDAYNREIYHPAVEENKRQEYLEKVFWEALHTREIEISTSDRLILLSTCTSEITNGRHILVGKMCDEAIPENPI